MDTTTLRSDLEADIAKRSTNLTSMRTLASRYGFSQTDIDTINRCSFPIIYAEWEGFFVFAMSLYLQSINQQHLSIDDLDEHYYVILCEKTYKQLKDYPDKFPKKRNFLYNFKNFMRNTGAVSFLTTVNTESNLGFDVMNTILNLYKIEKLNDHINNDAYSLKSKMNLFLDKRNGLAHGDPAASASNSDISDAIHLVEILMEHVKEHIIAAADADAFHA